MIKIQKYKRTSRPTSTPSAPSPYPFPISTVASMGVNKVWVGTGLAKTEYEVKEAKARERIPVNLVMVDGVLLTSGQQCLMSSSSLVSNLYRKWERERERDLVISGRTNSQGIKTIYLRWRGTGWDSFWSDPTFISFTVPTHNIR